MSKNKIMGIIFGILLICCASGAFTEGGQAEQPSYTVPRHTGTAAAGETGESSAEQERDELPVSQETEETSAGQETEELPISQEKEELPATQEQTIFSGPEDKNCTSYVIPDGVREIGKAAFRGCKSLTDIKIPDSVTKIDNAAFIDCSSLIGIKIPDSVTEIGGNAFSGCSSLTSVEIPGSVTEIGDNAFKGCSSLTSVEISDSVTKIGYGVFKGCSSLTSVEIPSSVTKIGDNAFKGCSSLTSVTLPKNLDINLSKVFGSEYSDIQFISAQGMITLDPYTMSSRESIKAVCGLVAPVEENVEDCHWDSYSMHPYDVVYDYGEDYQAYVDACDWSLVFDAEYYMAQFPMLALQYHYDEEELLFHFQTVGVHEGRQGCEGFNYGAYMMNGDPNVKSTFHNNPEGYYLYYMLNYDTEKDVNTVYREDGKPVKVQYGFRPTALQKEEQDAVNADREDVDVDTLTMVSETCALANYRAYLNAHDGYKAHDWAYENLNTMVAYTEMIGGERFAENTVTWYRGNAVGKVTEPYYYKSKDHYDAMVSSKYAYIGVSNVCNGKYSSSQFDYFTDAVK